MIKPDGIGRHTHTLTNFVVLNATENSDRDSAIFNGASTVSLREGPAVDIPTTIERSNNWNVFVIIIDPESVNYHFGKSPYIYGIIANPEFVKGLHSPR